MRFVSCKNLVAIGSSGIGIEGSWCLVLSLFSMYYDNRIVESPKAESPVIPKTDGVREVEVGSLAARADLVGLVER